MSIPLLRASIIAVLCAVLALLAGCGAVRLAYGQADTWAFRWLDGYVDFDDAQALRARSALGSWFTWNRRTQLAGYAELLARVDAAVPADTTPEKVCGWWSEVRQRIDLGLEQALPALAEVAVTLKPEQIENVERRYAKANREFRDDYLQDDPDRRHRAAVRRVVKRTESLYGTIDDAQRERIAARVGESPFDPQLALEERRQRQQDTVRVLRRLSAGAVADAAARAEIRALLQRLGRSPRDAYRRHAERLVEHNCRVAAEIHNGMSTAQRQVASKRLQGWIDDLRALAADEG